MKFNVQINNRRSIRLKGYDYAQSGAYFITLVTYHRDELFGRIVKGEMQYSKLGQIVHDEWINSNLIRKEIRILDDEFVIMPNHLHGIVWIVGVDGVHPLKGIRPNNHALIVGADDVRPNNDPLIVGADGVRPVDGVHPLKSIRPNNHALIVGADGVRPVDVVYPLKGIRPLKGVRPPSIELGATSPASPSAGNLEPLRRKPRSLSSFVAGFKSAVTSRAGRELNMSGIWQRNYYDHIIRDDQDFMNIREYIDSNPQKWQEDQLHPPVMIPSS